MTTLASTRNPRVRAAAELRERRARDRTGLTLVDGVREVDRALAAGCSIVEAFVDRERLGGHAGGDTLVDRLGVTAEIHDASAPVLERLAYGDRSEGVVAVVRIPRLDLARLRLPHDPLVVVLEGVEKPGNLGAVLRSADGAGADALLLADPLTDPFNPNAIRASIGTVFTVPIAAAATSDVRAFLRSAGIVTVTARVDAADSYTAVPLTGATAIVLGNEASGLSPEWDDGDVRPVRIPMHGIADSLNVSIAAAVLLYEARRQRGNPAGPVYRPASGHA